MSTGSETERNYAGIGITKTRHRLAPVFPIMVRAALLTSDLLPIRDEAWAASAGHDFFIQDPQPVRGHRFFSGRHTLQSLRFLGDRRTFGSLTLLPSLFTL